MNKKAKLKPLFSMGALALVAAACVSISGQFRVFENLSFVEKGLFKNKSIQVPAGTYNGRAVIDNRRVVFRFNTRSGNEKVEFKLPGGDLPLDGRWFTLSSSVTGQPYDVAASVDRDIVPENHVHRERESCTEQYCVTRCHGHGRDRVCEDHCYTEHGTRLVEYRYINTFWDTEFKLKSRGRVVATFSGDEKFTRKDVLYTGPCRTGYRRY